MAEAVLIPELLGLKPIERQAPQSIREVGHPNRRKGLNTRARRSEETDAAQAERRRMELRKMAEVEQIVSQKAHERRVARGLIEEQPTTIRGWIAKKAGWT